MASSGKQGPSQAAIVVGIILVALGAIGLLEALVPTAALDRVFIAVRDIWNIVWPCALVVAGGYLLWASKTGKLSGFTKAHPGMPFRRSRTDKRIFGVCGGIAYYFGVDATVVRLMAVILLFAFPLMVVVAYFVVAIFVPQA